MPGGNRQKDLMPFDISRRRLFAGATAVAVPILTSSSAYSRPGAAWHFYRSGTDQPGPVYAGPDKVVTVRSPIEIGADGRMPTIYLDPALSYRAVLVDDEGTELATLDPLPMATQSGPPAALSDTMRIVVSEAFGDGRFHPLSERFPTLEEARAVFPSAMELSESLCGAAIQSALDRAEVQGSAMQHGAGVFLPAGRYPLSRPLRIPSKVVLEGEGRDRTIIDNQNSSLDAPLIVNKDPSFASLSLRRMSLHGGTHGVKIEVSQYVDGLLIEEVSFQLQTDKNVECNKLLQMASFRDCSFGLSPFGVYVASWTSNVVAFDRCSFENHSRAHLYLRGAECVTCTGGRFEGGAVFEKDVATIDIEQAASVNFIGVYFENTHPLLLRDRRSRDGVSFSGCHFTGTTGPNGLVPYQFDSDGIVTFGTNDWGLVTQSPARVALHGVNEKLVTDGRVYLLRSATHHHIRSELVEVSRPIARELLQVRMEGRSATPIILTGRLAVELRRRSRDGGVPASTHHYRVSANATGDAVVLQVDAETPDAPALTIKSSPQGGAAATLTLAPDGPLLLRWTFDGIVSGVGEGARLDVDLA